MKLDHSILNEDQQNIAVFGSQTLGFLPLSRMEESLPAWTETSLETEEWNWWLFFCGECKTPITLENNKTSAIAKHS